jgi:pimeloyl-ACP methyl ester carboxylesterase
MVPNMQRLEVFLFAMAALAGLPSRTAADPPGPHTFDAKGVKIHFSVEGKGEPVVLIHALYSSADINWRLTGVIHDLAKDHEVISFDLPGHGRSDKPENDEAYGLQVVEDIVLLLDHLKIKRTHIVGYSAGGMIAMKFLALHSDRVMSATIGGMGWLREGGRIQKFWESVPDRERQRPPAAFARGLGKLALKESELSKIDVPVEILIGDRDPVKPLYVAPLRLVRKDWPVVEVPDAGHIDCIVKKEFREGIARWVRQNKQ